MTRSHRLFARVTARLVLAAAALPTGAALAQPANSAKPAQAADTARPPQNVNVPAGAGQDALTAQITPKGIMGRACPSNCTASSDLQSLGDIPAEVLPALATAKTTTIALDGGRRVLRIDADVKSKPNSAPAAWTMLVAAPLSSAKSTAPLVLWSGYLGQSKGLEGEEAVNVIRVEPAGRGSRIVIGEQRSDLTICGRPAIVAAREIDATTLTLARNAMVDSLTPEEKKKAEKVIATRENGAPAAPVIRLLRATNASSALEKKVAPLTDGSTESGWTEAKIGDGHGEWARMAASSDVGITGLSVQVRTTGAEVPDGAAPKSMYLASDDRLFQVELPDSAWNDKDARYEVKLPAELKTACLAVVLGEAHAPKGVTNPRVTIAEITAHTAFDALTYEALVAALSGGGDKAKAAAAMLGKGDSRAAAAVTATWDKLDESGKKLAMAVLDAAACPDQAPFYAGLLAQARGNKLSGSKADPVVVHARDRLRRCGRASAPPLAKLLREAGDPVRIAAAEELSLVAPVEAIAAILEVLPKAPDAVRRELRGALAKAANNKKAKEALADWVTPARFDPLNEVAKVDLLRAIGPTLPEIEGGKKALFGLAGKSAPFRTRFLLLAPTAELAAKGDAEALAFVREALAKDSDAHVRARAAEVAAKVPDLGAELVTAAGDAEVRVREAAVRALTQSAGQGNKLPASAEAVLVTRLTSDEWTFVRNASAEALAAMPKSESIDKALAGALGDASPEVRGRVLDGLGAHHARAYAGKVRDQAQKTEEILDVRARAVLALGAMCDKDSVEMLTKLSLGAKSLTSDVERRLGAAAISALGDIHPDDLAARLSPLSAKDAPLLVREMAKAAAAAKSTCEKKK